MYDQSRHFQTSCFHVATIDAINVMFFIAELQVEASDFYKFKVQDVLNWFHPSTEQAMNFFGKYSAYCAQNPCNNTTLTNNFEQMELPALKEIVNNADENRDPAHLSDSITDYHYNANVPEKSSEISSISREFEKCTLFYLLITPSDYKTFDIFDK